jgi:hypothetical protein
VLGDSKKGSDPSTGETLANQPEIVVFADGSTAQGFRHFGDVVAFGQPGLADNRPNPQYDHRGNTVLIKTESGRYFGLGQGVLVMLPELDRKTGGFGHVVGQQVPAIGLNEVAPNGLPELRVKKPWPVIDHTDPIDSVLVEHYTDYPADLEGAEHVGTPSPFDSAKEHLERVAKAMRGQ